MKSENSEFNDIFQKSNEIQSSLQELPHFCTDGKIHENVNGFRRFSNNLPNPTFGVLKMKDYWNEQTK